MVLSILFLFPLTEDTNDSSCRSIGVYLLKTNTFLVNGKGNIIKKKKIYFR